MINICQGCQERHPACWGDCPKYKEARAQHEKIQQEKIKARREMLAINSIQYHGLNKYQKRRRRKK